MEENTPPKVTAKQRVLEAQGKEVPVDLFLYSCLERERLIRATKGTGATIIEWAALAESADDVKSSPFPTALARMIGWYQEHFPPMKDRRPLDHEMLSEVIPGIVGLNTDLDRLYRLCTNGPIPDYDATSGGNEVWATITKGIQDNFPGYARFFLQYVQWSHGVEKVEHFEPGSRPPVGKYAPPPLRKDGDRGGRFGDRGGRGGDRDRGPRSGGDRGGRSGGSGGGGGDRPPRPEFSGGDRPPRPEFGGNDGPRPDRGPRPERGPRPDRDDRPRGDRPPRGDFGGDRGPRRGPNDENTAKLTDLAMAEVDQAIDRLRQDTSVDEVTLKPTNSFYRRIQHQKIVDSGYHSVSVGEGPDRAVKVARKGDA